MKFLLHIVSTTSKSLKDYVGPKEVVEIVKTYRKELQTNRELSQEEKKKEIEETTSVQNKWEEIGKAIEINALNGEFTVRLETKDKEEIGQKDGGNKRLNKDGDREDGEKFQRVVREKK